MPPSSPCSPQKRRHLLLSGSPIPVLYQKHNNFPSSSPSRPPIIQSAPTTPIPVTTLLYTMTDDIHTGAPPDIPTIPFSMSHAPMQTVAGPTLMERLTQETHHERLLQQEEMRTDKGTEVAYSRHLKNYETWWHLNQIWLINEDPTSQAMNPEPAHPITVTKAALFLKYESTREKVSMSA